MQENNNPIYEFLCLVNVNINHVMGLENNKPSLCKNIIKKPKCAYNLHKCDQVNKTCLHKWGWKLKMQVWAFVSLWTKNQKTQLEINCNNFRKYKKKPQHSHNRSTFHPHTLVWTQPFWMKEKWQKWNNFFNSAL